MILNENAQATGILALYNGYTRRAANDLKSASCALQNFNAVDEQGENDRKYGLSYLSRLNQADVLKHMPVLRKAQNDMKEGLQTS